MRQDARSLLERLNRTQFRYQDFTEAAEEIELWPLFQAVLRDPRIVGVRPVAEVAAAPAQPAEAMPANAAPADVVAVRTPRDARANLFARYRSEEPEDAAPAREPDIRQFLGRIGEKRP
jgi:hypothetical protein